MFLKSAIIDLGLTGNINSENCSYSLTPIITEANGKKAAVLAMRGSVMMRECALEKFSLTDTGIKILDYLKTQLNPKDNQFTANENIHYVQLTERSEVREELERHLCGLQQDILLIVCCTSVGVMDEVTEQMCVDHLL